MPMTYCAMGLHSRGDRFCGDLNQLVSDNYLGELRWYAGCRFSREWDTGTLKISQAGFRFKYCSEVWCHSWQEHSCGGEPKA